MIAFLLDAQEKRNHGDLAKANCLNYYNLSHPAPLKSFDELWAVQESQMVTQTGQYRYRYHCLGDQTGNLLLSIPHVVSVRDHPTSVNIAHQ